MVNIIFLDHFWKWELEAYLEGGVGALRLRVAGQVRFLGLLGWRLLHALDGWLILVDVAAGALGFSGLYIAYLAFPLLS